MYLTRRKLTSALAAGLASAWCAGVAWAQTYPLKTVKLVVGAAPGGPSDFLARLYADAIGPGMGHNFIVENKPGASGMPAADQVVKGAPDGHQLLISGPASIVVMPHMFSKITYDPMRDLVPVSMLGAGAFVLVVHPSVKANNVKELIALAKANPKQLTYGSGGNGSSGHLCTEYFNSLSGTQMTHVPYKGDGQAVIDLLAGQIQVMFTAPNVAMAHVKSGKLRLLAVTTKERVSSMPDVATVHEMGIKDFEYLGWIIVFAPFATPPAVVDQLSAAWLKVKNTTAITTKLNELAMTAPERYTNRNNLLEFVKAEYSRLGKLIKDNNIKSEV